ncbi:MAG: hypothetical protein PVJ19_01900 [Desulfobacteraceae bacterium]|jgi:hypothetical protein
MADNRPDPQVRQRFIPRTYLYLAVYSIIKSVFRLFAIFFMQLWGSQVPVAIHLTFNTLITDTGNTIAGWNDKLAIKQTSFYNDY